MIVQKNSSVNQLKNRRTSPRLAGKPAIRYETVLSSGRVDLSGQRPPDRELRDSGKFLWIRPEYTLPFFLAALIALNLCALISLWKFPVFTPPSPLPPLQPLTEIEEPEVRLPELFEGLSPSFLHEPRPVQDLISEYYRDPLSRDMVIDFFSRISGSPEIAEIILVASETYQVPPSLAFAVAWEESRYRTRAVNVRNRNGSVDRGLFQLNNRSFPKLSEKDFFDPRINTRYGISHLRWCLDTGGSEIVALAMYNAGVIRVNTNGTPKTTLEYVARILNSWRKIDSFFEAETERFNIEIPAPPITPFGELASMKH
jgi:hypothetical protein